MNYSMTLFLIISNRCSSDILIGVIDYNIQIKILIAGLDRLYDPGGAVIHLIGGGAVLVDDVVVRQQEAATGNDQLELGLGRVGQRREIGEPRGGRRR